MRTLLQKAQPKDSPQTPEDATIKEEHGKAAMAKNWYVLRVASNREEQVRDALDRKVKIEGLEDRIGRILVPTERRPSPRKGPGGEKKFIERKMTTPSAMPAMPEREPEPVTAQSGLGNEQPAPQRKPPKAVQKKQEQQQPAAVNEQTPFFE